MPTQRQLRVNNLLQREIAQIVMREMQNPDIGFVTVTGVDVSVDLRHARVFISVMGDDEAKASTMRAVIRARKFIRTTLAGRVDLRYIPDLQFRLDETAEQAQRLEEKLSELGSEAPADPDPAPPEGGEGDEPGP